MQTETYLFTCMRYIEMNPVRAGMVPVPEDFPWSSHRNNARGAPRAPITPHEEYLRLGEDPDSRGAAYRALFEEVMAAEDLDAIRCHMSKDRALGGPEFQRDLELLLHRPVGLVSPGRPRKSRGNGA